MATLDTAAGLIGYDQRGSGDLPLVFLHGVGSDRSAWAPQLAHFGKSRRAIAFDFPGYGDSAPALPSDEPAHDRFAHAILAAFDALGIERAHVCGLSLGGVVAIALAALAPRRIASLIIADSFLVHPDGPAIIARSHAASHDMAALAAARVPLLVAPGTDERLMAELRSVMAAIDPAAFRLASTAVWGADQRDRAAGIAVPTLVLCGAEDRITPPILSEHVTAAVADASFALIEQAGHLSNLERPTEFNALVDGFLTQIETRSSPADRQRGLLACGEALSDDRLDVAEHLLRAVLRDDPHDVAAIRMMAELAARLGRMGDAETLLVRALEIAPGFTAARANLALVLNRTGRHAEALAMADDLFAAQPDDLGHRNLKASILARLGRFDEAIALYRTVLACAPRQPRLQLSLGTMLKTIGKLDEAIAAYRAALVLQPTLGEVWWSLANLKTYRFDDADVADMRSALATPELGPEDRVHLDFALGKALHDRRDHAAAFDHYRRGNTLRLESQPYRAGDITTLVDRSIAVAAPALFAGGRGGNPARDPIFILGMPRAGSTLVEQILSSHPLVEGTGELPDLPAVARSGDRYPAMLADLTPEQRTALGTDYLDRAQVQRQTGRPHFTDKLPNNWQFVPFILAALPGATIIDIRRHPIACCLANYRQHFARGQAFTYDLADLGRYYSDYVRLMAHVDDVAPGRVHRVIYEQLVDDTEAQVRALLDACHLPFDPACLTFHETERAVRTPSSEQVRQPIYRDALAEWHAYEPYLGELVEALGPVTAAWPDAPDVFGTQS